MMLSRLDQSGKIMLTYIAIGLVLLGTAGVIIKVKFGKEKTQAQLEEQFTPEQKAIITAWKTCAAEMNQARAQLEQAKRDLNDLITAARAVAIAKGVDPNVQTTWLPMDGNPINCGDKHALWGFRADGTVIWKSP